METKKLYYEDSHLKTFSATVTGCAQVKKGWEITLDATEEGRKLYEAIGYQASDECMFFDMKP